VRGRRTASRYLAWAVGLLLVAGFPSLAGAESVDLQVWPNEIEIGTFYSGENVAVTGEIPAGAQGVVEITGPTQDEHLMRKGRRGGMWMNVGEVTIQGAPSLYLAAATDPGLLTYAPGAPGQGDWGYAAMEKRLKFAGGVRPGEEAELFQQFLGLKESEGLYGLQAKGQEISPRGDRAKVRASLPLSAKVRPGAYRVCLSAVTQGRVVAQKCTDLQVLQVGFPALLYSLAYEHGGVYGILAVVIAIVTGFIMGYLFTGKGGGGGH
jgi:uncharacterized protein (TIGR02186 family)